MHLSSFARPALLTVAGGTEAFHIWGSQVAGHAQKLRFLFALFLFYASALLSLAAAAPKIGSYPYIYWNAFFELLRNLRSATTSCRRNSTTFDERNGRSDVGTGCAE